MTAILWQNFIYFLIVISTKPAWWKGCTQSTLFMMVGYMNMW